MSDRLRPEILIDIRKKKRAYPHEILAMVAEIEALRKPEPVVEEGAELDATIVPTLGIAGRPINSKAVKSKSYANDAATYLDAALIFKDTAEGHLFWSQVFLRLKEYAK